MNAILKLDLLEMQAPKKLLGSAYEFYPDDRGFYYLRLRDGEEFGIKHISEIQAYIEENFDEQAQPFLIELGYGSTFGDDLQEHLVNSENRFSTADAILISTFAHKLITKFYQRQYKPKKPTKVFHDIFDALEWIAQQG